MIRTPRPRLARSGIAALLALAAGVLASASAEASVCGRQVHARFDGSLLDLAILAEPPAEADVDAPAPAKPCDGPSCRQAPASPASPSHSDPARARIDRWSCLDPLAAIAPPGGSTLVVAEPEARPIDRAESLERPPRTLPSRSA